VPRDSVEAGFLRAGDYTPFEWLAMADGMMISAASMRGHVRFVARTGARGGRVTDGLVLLAAWLEFVALLAVLGYLLLRRGR
jgi:hypothetical protein